MNKQNIEIGKRIKQRREELGMTQGDLGNKLCFNKSTIQRYETGKIASFKLPVLQAFAQALNVNPDWLALKTDQMGSFYNMPRDNIPICECGYTPSIHGEKFTHEEYHKRYKKAVKKFGVYYPQDERDRISKEMTDILATNPPLEKQIECQNKIIECCFSESLQKNNFDLRHYPFDEYRSYILGQPQMPILMSDECRAAMTDKYSTHYSFDGIIFPLNEFAETNEEKNKRLLLDAFNNLNEEGQRKVIDYAYDIMYSGKYKPDPDD